MRVFSVMGSGLLLAALIGATIGCGGEESTSGDSGTTGTNTSNTSNDDAAGDDTAGDDTAGDDTAGDDTAGDDATGDDAAGDDAAGDDTAGDDAAAGDNGTGDNGTGDADASTENNESADAGAGDAAAEWGNLIVHFKYDGDAPAAEAIVPDGQDAAYCADDGLVKEDLVVNGENGGIANVVGFLSVGRGEEPPAAHPSNEEAKKQPVILDNINCRFVPHMVIVQTGQTLIVKNSDEIGHNAKANLVRNVEQAFSDNLPAGKQNEYSFENAESLPMIVECTAHKWMSARLFILDHPFVGKSDADGKLVIPNLPVGTWTIRFNHEKAGNLRDIEIAGGTTSRRGEVEIEIKPGDNDIGVVKLGAANFE